MEVVTGIFDTLGQIATEFGSFLASLFEGVVQLFWTEGAGSEPGQLTFLGVVMLLSLATGLFIWAFGYLRRLIGGIGTKSR